MIEFNWIKLPLYDSWDYEYTVTINDVNVTIRLFYSDRTKSWSMDLSYTDGEFIAEGVALHKLDPVLKNSINDENGFFWIEPISENINQTVLHPDQLHKYYNFYYIYM